MAKLADAIAALAAAEATRGLAAELEAALGGHAALEAGELGRRLAGAAEAERKAAELMAKVEAYEREKAERLIADAFAEACVGHGVRKDAVGTAFRLLDRSRIEVDGATGEVRGLDDALFGEMRRDHPALFEPSGKPSYREGLPQDAPERPVPLPPPPPPAPPGSLPSGDAGAAPGAIGFFVRAARM
jgi:hypothetical protein